MAMARGRLDDSTTITPRGNGGHRYELHLSDDLNDRLMEFFHGQKYHSTPSDLLQVIVRNGLKVLIKRKLKAQRKAVTG